MKTIISGVAIVENVQNQATIRLGNDTLIANIPVFSADAPE